MNDHEPDLEGGDALAAVQLGLPESVVQLKLRCAMRLNAHIDKLGWTQERIGRALGLRQPHVSELRNYALDRFSTDRLLHFMAGLGLNVSIVIEEQMAGQAQASEAGRETIQVRPVGGPESKAA